MQKNNIELSLFSENKNNLNINEFINNDTTTSSTNNTVDLNYVINLLLSTIYTLFYHAKLFINSIPEYSLFYYNVFAIKTNIVFKYIYYSFVTILLSDINFIINNNLNSLFTKLINYNNDIIIDILIYIEYVEMAKLYKHNNSNSFINFIIIACNNKEYSKNKLNALNNIIIKIEDYKIYHLFNLFNQVDISDILIVDKNKLFTILTNFISNNNNKYKFYDFLSVIDEYIRLNINNESCKDDINRLIIILENNKEKISNK